MDVKALLLVVTVSVCWFYQANGAPVCKYFFEPFEGKMFQGVSLYQCRQFCMDADKFQCKSFMYSSIGMSCILSDTTRKLPPAKSGYNNYQYFQSSPECNPVNLNDKITTCSASNVYSKSYTCEDSYGGTEVAAIAHAAWAMQRGKGEGEWMQVNLDGNHVVTSIDLLPRCHRQSQFSSLNIRLGRGVIIPVSRTCGGTNSWTDCSGLGNAWFSVNCPYPIRTNYVKFEVTGVCDPAKVAIGIRELKVNGV